MSIATDKYEYGLQKKIKRKYNDFFTERKLAQK